MKIFFPVLLALSLLGAPAFAADQTVMLSVPDMNCAVCPITVKKALLKTKGVKAVKIDFDSRKATVSFDDAKTTAAI